LEIKYLKDDLKMRMAGWAHRHWH